MINKERIKQSVLKGIALMPYDAAVKRDILDIYKQPTGERQDVTTLTGLLYKEDSSINIVLGENNETRDKPSTRFLVDYNDSSILVKAKDILIVNDAEYLVLDTGMNFEIYFNMVVRPSG